MPVSINLPRVLLAIIVLVIGVLPVNAQNGYPTVFPKPILILDQERLFAESNLGQAMTLALALQRTVLLQESREIYNKFEAEEQHLTEIRAATSLEEFRLLSEDFDRRVQQTREVQLRKDVVMQQAIDRQQRRFLTIAVPYLSEIMVKYFAGAILDKRSVVVFNRDMDITDEAIVILDRAFAENPDMAIEKE